MSEQKRRPEVERLLKLLEHGTTDEQYAEQMGFRCAVDGPNEVNCNFRLFGRPELTKAWERGKKRGEVAK